MKKAIITFLLAAVVCVCAFCFIGCAEGADDKTDDVTSDDVTSDDATFGDVTSDGDIDPSVDFVVYAAFTASSEVMELTYTTSVKDYLDALAEDGLITFEGYESSYGYYITAVNGIEEQTTNTATGSSGWSWMVYTDFTEDDGTIYADPAYGTFEYNGTTLASASYGVSYLPCVEGYTYALVYQSWSYSY